MSITKIGKSKWRAIASYRVNGELRQPSKVFYSEREALEWERTQMLRRDASSAKVTFQDAVDLYISKKEKTVQEETLAAITYKLNHFMDKLRPMKLSAIKPITLEKWRKALVDDPQYSDKYKNEILNLCKAVFKMAAKMWEVKDPSTHLEIVRKSFDGDVDEEDTITRILTVREFQLIYNALPEKSDADKYHKALIMATWSTGWRRGEGKAIQWKNYTNGVFEIRKSASGKHKGDRSRLDTTKTRSSVRRINVDEFCDDELKRLLAFVSNVEGHNPNWFMFGGLKPLSNTQILDRWRNALIASGLFRYECEHCHTFLDHHDLYMKYSNSVKCPECKQKTMLPTPVRFHDLRHSHATILINSGVPVSAVSARLGHSSINMTLKVYTHVTKQAVQVMIEKLPNLHFVDILLTRETPDKQKTPS